MPDFSLGRRRVSRDGVPLAASRGVLTSLSASLVFVLVFGAAMAALTLSRSTSAPPAVRSAMLDLKVERVQSKLVLSWNAASEPVMQALSSAITITDGKATESIPLLLSELRAGQLTYRPMTRNVVFQLEVSLRMNAMSESVQWTDK